MEIEVTDATFDQEVLKSDIPVLVDFWAVWCGPCKAMLPIMEEIAHEYAGKVKVAKVNVDENIESAGRYNVMSIPTFLIVKGGQVVDTVIGAKPKEEFTKRLDAVLG